MRTVQVWKKGGRVKVPEVVKTWFPATQPAAEPARATVAGPAVSWPGASATSAV
jgi:hypothetical protein